MKTIRTIFLTALLAGSGLALSVAQAQPAMKGGETVTIVADVPIPNQPGKRLVSRVIDYPPGTGSVSHRHARSAFIYAYVLLGEVRSQVDDEPARVYRAGESWFENPGAHHRVSQNASDTKPARLLAVIVVDDADKQITIPDQADDEQATVTSHDLQQKSSAHKALMPDQKAGSPRLRLHEWRGSSHR
jgi:quercetin dioxygenase-like cupin family protein